LDESKFKIEDQIVNLVRSWGRGAAMPQGSTLMDLMVSICWWPFLVTSRWVKPFLFIGATPRGILICSGSTITSMTCVTGWLLIVWQGPFCSPWII
jgi:uncharacterized membrane protein